MDHEPKPHEEANPSQTLQTSQPEKQRVPVSCTKAFDSVYFCYSPFHQARQMYILGELDDCRGRLKKFRMCVMSRFRPQSESEVIYEQEEQDEKNRKGLENIKPVWEFREEYLENVARAERDERQQQEGQTEDQSAWWL
ncbi:hypothetical protein FGB62_4g259 [Gracilaria domingensis]|nr:hypothetical protein FGB62_4g259 [Gracilaria domingensis]